MTSPRARRPETIARSVLAPIVAAAALGAVLAGCEGEPEVQSVARPAPVRPKTPPPPPAPTVTPVEQLMAQLSIDERVVLPESEAPDTDAKRIALLEFFDAFARGDDEALASMMSELDRAELEELEGTPEWKETISGIREITIETGTGPYGEQCALAIFEVGNDFQPQLWYYKADDDRFQFDAAPTPPNMMSKLYGDDFIARWHEILQEEIALANQLDAEIETGQIVLGEASGGGRPAAGGRPAPRDPASRPRDPAASRIVDRRARSASPPERADRAPGGPPPRRPVGTHHRPSTIGARSRAPMLIVAHAARERVDDPIDQRVAIVTGASRGIGRAIAGRLAADGRLVVLVGRTPETLEVVRSEIDGAGGAAETRSCDVGDGEALASMVEEVGSTHGRLDILVNNAGVTRDGLMLRMSDRDFDEVIRVNLRSAFIASRAAARPMMRGRFGRIVSIGSVTGLMGNPGQANYAAAKAGLVGLTKTVAREFASKGITANLVAPGFVETDMVRALPEATRADAVKSIPARRFGTPEEIAHAVAYLTSDGAGYVTGQVLVVDGGMLS